MPPPGPSPLERCCYQSFLRQQTDARDLEEQELRIRVSRPRPGSGPVHLLVDSTGLKLCGSGEWPLEKHGTKTRRSWRKLHIAVDADTGEVAAAAVTTSDVDDASQVGSLLDQVSGPVASFTADGAYDQNGVYGQVVSRHPEASVIVPPRSSAVPSETAQTATTIRGFHLQTIAERGPNRLAEDCWLRLASAGGSRYQPFQTGRR